MICDMCGVKVATKSIRSTRFAHIDLTIDVQHPLDPEAILSCFPVVPADFLESPVGEQLQGLYDQLIETNARGNPDDVSKTANGIVEWLTPVVVTLQNWNIQPACNTLAHGIALEARR